MAKNARGTHVLQLLVKNISSQTEEDAIINKVRIAGVHHLVKNQNSVHILIQIVNKIHTESTQFILDYILANFKSIAKDKCGICLVKAAQVKQSWLP